MIPAPGTSGSIMRQLFGNGKGYTSTVQVIFRGCFELFKRHVYVKNSRTRHTRSCLLKRVRLLLLRIRSSQFIIKEPIRFRKTERSFLKLRFQICKRVRSEFCSSTPKRTYMYIFIVLLTLPVLEAYSR